MISFKRKMFCLMKGALMTFMLAVFVLVLSHWATTVITVAGGIGCE